MKKSLMLLIGACLCTNSLCIAGDIDTVGGAWAKAGITTQEEVSAWEDLGFDKGMFPKQHKSIEYAGKLKKFGVTPELYSRLFSEKSDKEQKHAYGTAKQISGRITQIGADINGECVFQKEDGAVTMSAFECMSTYYTKYPLSDDDKSLFLARGKKGPYLPKEAGDYYKKILFNDYIDIPHEDIQIAGWWYEGDVLSDAYTNLGTLEPALVKSYVVTKINDVKKQKAQGVLSYKQENVATIDQEISKYGKNASIKYKAVYSSCMNSPMIEVSDDMCKCFMAKAEKEKISALVVGDVSQALLTGGNLETTKGKVFYINLLGCHNYSENKKELSTLSVK